MRSSQGSEQSTLKCTHSHPNACRAPGREPLGLHTAAAGGRDSALKLGDLRVDFRAARAVAFLQGAALMAVVAT